MQLPLIAYLICGYALFLGYIFLHANTALSQNSKTEQPSFTPLDTVIAPWHISGPTGEFKAETHKTLKAATERLSEKLGTKMDSPELLNQIKDQNNNFLASLISAYTFVKVESGSTFKNTIIQPSVCKIKDNLLISTFIHNLTNFQLIFLDSNLIPSDPPSITEIPQILSNQLAAGEKIISRNNKPSDNLKISINKASGTHLRKNSYQSCLNILLARHLSMDFQVIYNAAYTNYKTLVNFNLFTAESPLKPTRALMVNWQANDNLDTSTLKGDISISEGVFGHHLSKLAEGSTVIFSDAQPEVRVSSLLLERLNIYRSELAFDEPPKAVHKHKAWVYLNKGRAWGLKMGDRLISESGKSAGHVVGYYGPTAKLKDFAGQPISEGAILYVRKGQKQVQKGDRFIWDPKKFPTPWPPSQRK